MIRKIKYIVGNFSKEKAAENILPTEFVILNMEPYIRKKLLLSKADKFESIN